LSAPLLKQAKSRKKIHPAPNSQIANSSVLTELNQPQI
jgi:hypothetical protein